MNEGWQVGDMALCVGMLERCSCGCVIPEIKGRVFTVSAVLSDAVEGTGLCFSDLHTPPEHEAFQARNFRKIKPDAWDACEDEFVTLIKRAKHPVAA